MTQEKDIKAFSKMSTRPTNRDQAPVKLYSSSNNKTNASSDAKIVYSNKCYRHVKECISKLDQHNQHRRNLLSLFQHEQVKLRSKVRDACEKLMFVVSPIEQCIKAESLLWKKCFYEVIQAIKSRKVTPNLPGAMTQPELMPYFQQFLNSAVGYYTHLRLKMSEKHPNDYQYDYRLLASPLHNFANSTLSKEAVERWNEVLSYRIFSCLGDLCRYQNLFFGADEELAVRHYMLALQVQPGQGQPYNQLATLIRRSDGRCLQAAYYYCCALQNRQKYEQAEKNLDQLFDHNNGKYHEIHPDSMLDNTGKTSQKKKLQCFVVSFIYLFDLFRPKTYARDADIYDLCSRFMEALRYNLQCIRNSSHEKTTTNCSKTQNGVEENKNVSKSANKCVDEDSSSCMSGEDVFHIFVICLSNIHDLKDSRSPKLPAAVAFLLELTCILVQHLIELSGKNTDKKKTKVSEEINFADGDKPKTASVARNKCDVTINEVGAGDDINTSSDDACKKPAPLRRKIVLAPNFSKPIKSKVKKDSVNNACVEVAKLNGKVQDLKIEDAKIKEKNKKFNPNFGSNTDYINLLTGRNHMTSSLKLACDWMINNLEMVDVETNYKLFQLMVEFSNMLPSASCMIDTSEKKGSCLKDFLSDENDKENIDSNKEKLVGMLPEDKQLFHMNFISKSAKSSTKTDDLTDFDQLCLRVFMLRKLLKSHVSAKNKPISIEIDEKEKFTITSKKGEKVEFTDLPAKVERIKDLRREEQMKKMAVSKLKLEVEQLQSDLLLRAVTSQFTTLYVLPDTATMCSHLHLIKKLVASGKFLLVVCNTVIEGLDRLKKGSQEARFSIRYLEHEFQKGNRYLRSQKSAESVSVEVKKNKENEEIVEMIECARHITDNHQFKTKDENENKTSLVTILTDNDLVTKSHVAMAQKHNILVRKTSRVEKSLVSDQKQSPT